MMNRCVDKLLMCADDIKYYDKHKCLAYVFGAEAMYVCLRKIAFALNAVKFCLSPSPFGFDGTSRTYLLRARAKNKKKGDRGTPRSVQSRYK